MAINLNNIKSTPSSTNRSLLYTAPAGYTSIVYDGTITNLDNTNNTIQYIVLETLDTTGNYWASGNAIAVPYGVSPRVPKITLKPGESLYITTTGANLTTFVGSVVERSN